jgi:hypothetical protein
MLLEVSLAKPLNLVGEKSTPNSNFRSPQTRLPASNVKVIMKVNEKNYNQCMVTN